MLISPEKFSSMENSWIVLFDRFHIPPTEAYPIWDRVSTHYLEPHRHYHNLEHISEMLKVIGKCASLASEGALLQLGVWFHDVIYDPKSSTNEEDSIILARELLTPKISLAKLDLMASWIMATKHQSLEINLDSDFDLALFLDADLAILGAEAARYTRYAKAIRLEYAFVDDTVYNQGRRKVLQGFLARPRIYHTDRLFEMGEKTARENLLREIEEVGKI